MGKKFFMKMLLVALFIAVPFTSVASTAGVDFDGPIYCGLDGLYYLGPIAAYPLNVNGLLEVSADDITLGKITLGKLIINAQKTSIFEETWDGTYYGHWIFTPSASELAYDWGIMSSLSGCGSGVVNFILDGFPELLGMTGDQMIVSGSMGDGGFNGSMVPIPGALLLFGSGLLGLICIRRK